MRPKTDQLPTLPGPNEILNEQEETIRQILNAHATDILKERSESAYERYEEFCNKYDRAIYRAWYAECDESSNILFGYKLIEEIAQGAFGRVFRAETPDGEEVAVKLLKGDVRHKREMLQSFRRGVRSMHILSQHNVEGMVAYREASEIPTFVVMDLVNGPDLGTAVKSGYLKDWTTIMRIAVDIAHIIRDAHMLPERVLHRDIRPSNIMLKNYYTTPDDWEVVVLDFDLSWHLGSVEKSVVNSSTMSGFLAPEQVQLTPSASTRNALVDSFGLGMTLLFLRTGKEPQYLQHRHRDWQQTLHESIGRYKCSSWHSLPTRFARLIEYSTRDKQSERWDMSQIEGELERLMEAEREPGSVQSAELWAEELAARVMAALGTGPPYEWEPDKVMASIRFVSGVDFNIIAHETERKLEAQISWISKGDQDYRTVMKYLPDKCKRAASALQKGGWRLRGKPKVSQDTIFYYAEKRIASLPAQLDSAVGSLAQAIKELQFT